MTHPGYENILLKIILPDIRTAFLITFNVSFSGMSELRSAWPNSFFFLKGVMN